MNIAVAQFQPKNGDKAYNLSAIEELTKNAKTQGADIISFHELSVTAYTYIKNLGEDEIFELAELVPGGNSTKELIRISSKFNIPILAGLVEKENNKIYNTYICVSDKGLVAKHRKLHPFISKYMSAGDNYTVFDLFGWKCSILICYDNNVIENVRATVLLGADLIIAPHVTCCTPSAIPGSGYIDDKLWKYRHEDPASLRQEFDGIKGREWLMRWLPARAYDNGVYYAFTNPIGYDGEHLKNGNSMIIDPFGKVVAEIKTFDDDIIIAEITKDKIPLSGGWRYRNARRPELYKEIIGGDHNPVTKPVWLNDNN